jgi:uncharacterized membrane protein
MMESRTMSRAVYTAMPRSKWAAAVPLVALLAACGADKSPAPRAEPDAAAEPASPSSSGVPLRGIVATSGSGTTFRECGAPATRTTAFTDPRGELAKAVTMLSANLAQGVYVELGGAPAADGTLAWTALLRVRSVGEGLACAAPLFDGEFAASGNEPFWAVEIRENGITYRSPEIPKGRTYPYAFTRTPTGSVVYATKIETPSVSTLEVALTPSTCFDSMSGELRGFKAHVTLDGRKLEGCAARGVPRGELGSGPLDELNRFAGTYPRAVDLWKDPAIEKRLPALLGTAMPAFLANMKVQGPVTKDGGVFYVSGNKPRQGRLDSAIFLADPTSDTIEVILFENGARREFKEGGRDVVLPAEIVTIIDNMEKP